MKTLEAVFKIVTPLFMSGADQTIAELRPPSIKGIIRFWWRALAYSRFKGDLIELANREADIFGSTEQVASIIIRVSSHSQIKITQKNTVHHDFKSVAGARYLGFGLMDAFDGANTTAGRLQRPCINQDQQFTVTFISKSDIPEEFINAVKLTGLLGGLGSRSRKGYGSLTLNTLTLDNKSIWVKPVDDKAHEKILGDLLDGMDMMTKEPLFSAFSQFTRIDCLLQGNDPIRLLNIFGQQMLRYRSWGKEGMLRFEDSRNGRVIFEESEKNFKPDHQWYKRLDGYRESDFHPQRVIFGLPHNYRDDNVTGAKHDRRSSPLLVHVHEYASNRYSLISIVLRAKFLPDIEKTKDGKKIMEREEINAGNKPVSQHIEWELIDKFLDGKVGHRETKSNTLYFPNKDTWFGG